MDRIEIRKRKRRQRTNRIRAVILVIFLIAAGVVGYYVKTVIGLSAEQHSLKQENAELKEKKKALEAELRSINENSYIEEQARKQLNMVMPGEVVYIIEEKNKEKEEGQE